MAEFHAQKPRKTLSESNVAFPPQTGGRGRELFGDSNHPHFPFSILILCV